MACVPDGGPRPVARPRPGAGGATSQTVRRDDRPLFPSDRARTKASLTSSAAPLAGRRSARQADVIAFTVR